MELWTAFIFGLVGSLHCIGMCGPIALSLSQDQKSKFEFAFSRLIYNIGRVITYALLGAVCGWIGQTIALAGYQSGLSIAIGILILVFIFVPSKFARRIIKFSLYHKTIDRVMGFWGKLFRYNSNSSMLLIGLLNGFLPCGLVYVALAAAATTGSASNGLLYMAMFGLGTIPVMLAVSLLGMFVNVGFKRFINRLIPVGGVILAILIILRGLSLGIPYISPKITTQINGEQKIDCCGKPSESK